MQKLSIIIPAYNEQNTIVSILKRVSCVQLIENIQKEIIVVNDCSTDETEHLVKEYISKNASEDINYVKHEINKGKGSAIQPVIRSLYS